jgi:hypothetical protein
MYHHSSLGAELAFLSSTASHGGLQKYVFLLPSFPVSWHPMLLFLNSGGHG